MVASQRVIHPQQQVYGGPRSRRQQVMAASRQQVMAASYGGKLWRQVTAASQRVIHPQQQVYGGNITGTWEVDTGQQARAEGSPGHWHRQPIFGGKYTRPH